MGCMALPDALGRPLRDLRISVTDRCNFRCTYCMPKEVFGSDFQFLQREDLLTFERSRAWPASSSPRAWKDPPHRREPLVRRDLRSLVAQIADRGFARPDAATNGSLLPAQAQGLKDAGLQRLTVSLDSLDDATFRRMNDVNFPVQSVLDGINAAAEAGLSPIKINAVVQRGVNDDGIVELARHFKGSGHIVRFIEFMDVGTTNGWRMDEVVSAREIVERINAVFPIEPAEANYAGEVAQRWRYLDGSGEVGVIASITQPFCGDCTRARLSPEGSLYTCLFSNHGHDFRGLLRSGASDADISDFLGSVWRVRDDRYSEIRTKETTRGPRVEMSHIGG
jgi:cyclic pyranopterin phosphate synthase